MLLIPCALVLLAPSSPAPAALDAALSAPFERALHSRQEGEDFVARYHAAFEARDADALGALWASDPGRVLVTIDADLEASLSVWEGLLERAQFGAEVASSTLGEPIFADYASSFAGWTPEQKRQFRAGQKAYGDSRRAGGAGELETSLAKARECVQCAEPLGDWWGTAMGLLAEAQALQSLERPQEALVAASRARLLYHQLGLGSSEVGALQLQTLAALAADRPLRARSSANAMLALFGEDGPPAGRAAAYALRAQAERSLGLEEAAAESAAAAQRLAGD
ncbi:MAG: Cif family virulence factor [Planctomycetota bacterium]|jgi:hypothetical protein